MQSREEGKKYGQRQVQLIEHFIEHWESSRKVHFPIFIFPCLMKIHLLWLHRKRRNKRELSFLFLLSSSSKHLSLPGLEAKRGELVERDRREQRYPPSTPLTQLERAFPWMHSLAFTVDSEGDEDSFHFPGLLLFGALPSVSPVGALLHSPLGVWVQIN